MLVPLASVYAIVEYAEEVFKANVCNDDHKITRQERLKERLVMKVCNHFILAISKTRRTWSSRKTKILYDKIHCLLLQFFDIINEDF
jgi:hypothetical protein